MIDWTVTTPDERRRIGVQADATKRGLIELRIEPRDADAGLVQPEPAYLDIETADVLIEALSIGIHEAGRYEDAANAAARRALAADRGGDQ